MSTPQTSDSLADGQISNVAQMSSMFSEATQFNKDIGEWDVSKVTNMSYVLRRHWSMGCQQVRNMRFLFSEAIEFGYFLEQGNNSLSMEPQPCRGDGWMFDGAICDQGARWPNN